MELEGEEGGCVGGDWRVWQCGGVDSGHLDLGGRDCYWPA